MAFSHAQTPPPVRIMPLGDSITAGNTGLPDPAFVPGAYRKRLFDLLTAAGYNPDFVGTLTLNPAPGLPDPDHEGHGGWQVHQLDEAIAGWVSAIDAPDVILLHIGTNDLDNYRWIDTPGYDPALIIGRLDALITKITQLRPFAHIIVTNLLERDNVVVPNDGLGADSRIQEHFNPYVQPLVNSHAAQGHRVTFLDMRGAVPLADMPDQLHPNQTGYDKMADAWLPAIQAVMTPLGDHLPPAIAALDWIDSTHVAVTFSKPVADDAAALANFSIGGLTISGAALDPQTKRVVTLTTATMPAATPYTLGVSGVQDRLAVPNFIAPATTATFWTPAIPGAPNNVPEASSYSLVYSLNVPDFAQFNVSPPAYSVDDHAAAGAFTRVAYYLELQKTGGPLEFCWVSMDPFTSDTGKIGVPCVGTSASFQQGVANMRVVSNVAGVANGSGLGGRIEFWPTDFLPANSANVPGASATEYDFGDEALASGDYGSMQIHHPGGARTLIGFSGWGANYSYAPDLGIGNNLNAAGDADWTLARNAAGYSVRKLQVFVLPAAQETRLSSLAVSGAALAPAFASETPGYSATVQHGTASVTVTPAVWWAGATVTVNGNAVASGSPSEPIALNVGANSISVVVTAQNGAATRSYTVQITRQSYYQTWAAGQGIGGSGPEEDFDSDGSSNLLELAFGTNAAVSNSNFIDLTIDFGPPWQGVINARGKPTTVIGSTSPFLDFRAVYGRRKDYIAAGLTYTVEFSADLLLNDWTVSAATPTVFADDGEMEAVSVLFPQFIDGKSVRFFRVTVGQQ